MLIWNNFFLAEDIPVTKYCQIILNKENYHALSYAVKNHYWYQMYIGKLQHY